MATDTLRAELHPATTGGLATGTGPRAVPTGGPPPRRPPPPPQ
jgi:hypothetical protein